MNGNDVGAYAELNLSFAVPLAAVTILVSTLLAWALTRRRSARTRWIVRGIALPLFIALNPLSNWIFWEPLNKHLLTAMKMEAERVGLEGKTFTEIRWLFGEPSFVWGPNQEQVVTWNYLRPGWYLLGSKFQVHFRAGVVYGWEPYDD
jgi:hypothetical protein